MRIAISASGETLHPVFMTWKESPKWPEPLAAKRQFVLTNTI